MKHNVHYFLSLAIPTIVSMNIPRRFVNRLIENAYSSIPVCGLAYLDLKGVS